MQLFDDFRWMINEAIRLSIESKITSKLALRNLVYKRFKSEYNTYFINMAVFKAHSIWKNYRNTLKRRPSAKKPYVKKNFIIIYSYNVRLTGDYLHFSTKPRQFTAIKLNQFVISKLSQDGVKIDNLIIRENEIVIPYYTVEDKKSGSCIGIDMNFENITTFDGQNQEVYNTSKILNYKQKVRETLSHFTRNDIRIRKKLAHKYGKKQKDKEHFFLHDLANKIVSQNKIPVIENLKHIRNRGRKGDGKGKKFRFKLHMWSRFKLKQLVEYKSRDKGMLPIYVNPKGTSSNCSICEGKMILEENRLMKCSACSVVLDRDINAARNIWKRGLWFGPVAQQGEGMKQLKDVNQIVVSVGIV